MIEKQTFLLNNSTDDGKIHDKVYHVQLLKLADGYKVAFQFGKRGKTLKYGTKTPTAVRDWEALDIYNTLIRSKKNRGYHIIEISPEEKGMLEFMIALSY